MYLPLSCNARRDIGGPALGGVLFADNQRHDPVDLTAYESTLPSACPRPGSIRGGDVTRGGELTESARTRDSYSGWRPPFEVSGMVGWGWKNELEGLQVG